MLSAEWMQQKNIEHKQKIEELTALCTELKEELARKELKEYEQDVRIRDLKTQLKELSDVEDKLSLANRNARVLEEENNSLLLKLKSGELEKKARTMVRAEAMKLIEENNHLRSDIDELRTSNNKVIQREHQLEHRCKFLTEEQEKADAQILSLKKKNTEIEDRFREEQHQWALVKEAWEAERTRYIQDYEELLASIQRFDGSTQQRECRDIKERGNEQQLQQALLKEDIAELEEKMRLAEDRFRAKEKEWCRLESALRCEIDSLKNNNNQGDKDVYHAFQEQLASFKQEVTAFRGERRISRVPLSFPMRCAPNDDEDERISELETELQTNTSRIKTLEEINDNLSQKNMEVSKENELLREEIENLQDKCSRMEDRSSEREVRIKELEVLLASAKKNTMLSVVSDIEHGTKREKVSDFESDDVLRENEQLRATLRHYERQLTDLKSSHAEQLAFQEARQNGQLAQIEELLRKSDGTRLRFSEHNSLKAPPADRFHEIQDFILNENEQYQRKKVGMDPVLINKFTKDKLDCVDEVMRALEDAWASEDESKRKIKKLRHENAELVAAIAGVEQRGKEDELRRDTQHFDPREEQCQKDVHPYQAGKEHLTEQLYSLQYENKLKDDKINDLQARLVELENRFKNDKDLLRRQEGISKENEIEQRMRELEAAIVEKEADPSGISKSRDKRIQELNTQLATMREANDGLWKQLVNLQEKKTASQGRPSSGRNSRTPRGSARRHSVEHLTYSQPSTQLSEERRRAVVADGAHLAVTIVELSDVMRNGKPITEPGYVIIKGKSVKEKYKTSVKELASVIRFDETFVFYLAQPDEDVITLHVYYKAKNSSREYHVGDACFTMASLYRGVPRQRLAIVAQNPGTKDARRSAQVEVIMQSDDFGKMTVPTEAEIEDEKLRFNELLKRMEISSPENLHCVDVLMAANTIP
ncbi:viral A-type inclusion protein [Trypanosoma rangeli]|uniref:Viral A-type inclusion protein n=1 Tax=Trypanosoma rangeli TaxID=5698 RepID=A0A3R7KUQ1_TRYRA|nr:viral A-type inclusion protein [Trypanosoma rangeli]RNF01733.1 viral A-type inclusion protein [Trypanosoma rangeli]|eukprot:RNF01733.1 viral A-type inclusion protein [Trypanosoma rangeli]